MTPPTGGLLELLYILMPAGCLVMLAALLRGAPGLWNATVGALDAGRNHTIDGARGLLALWVLTHHLDIGPQLATPDGGWIAPDSVLGDLMRTGFFVAPFFMLTAVIFGGRLLQTRGELRPLSFLKKRLFRLLPTYVLSVALIFVAAFALTDFELRVSAFKLAKQTVRWLLLDFVGRYDFNTIDVSRAHGMLWTLRHEVMFYLFLIPLSWLQRRLSSPLPLFAGMTAAAAISPVFIFFLAGIVTAAVLGWTRQRFTLAWQVAAIAAVAALILTAGLYSRLLQGALLIPILVSLVQEGALFRWLRWRPLRFVGEVSYSVYILHYPLIWIVYTVLLSPAWAERLPYAHKLLVDVACGIAIIGISTLAFVAVERPFVRLGQRLTAARVRGLVRAGAAATGLGRIRRSVRRYG